MKCKRLDYEACFVCGLPDNSLPRRYQSVEGSATAGTEVPLPSEWTLPHVKDWLTVHATAVNAETPVYAEVDLFEQGFDRYM